MSGKKILLAWEMGAGLGHTRRLLQIGRALKEVGHTVILAQRTIHTLAGEVRSAGIAMLQAPQQRSLAPKGKPFRALTYADIMGVCGYADIAALEPVLDAWDGLLSGLKPDLIIGDYCPILPLAARGRYPYLAFGDGFVVPPHETDAFPPLRQQGEPMFDHGRLLEIAQDLLMRRGQPLINRLGEITSGDAQAVITLPQLDIYNRYRGTPAFGPLEELPPMAQTADDGPLYIYLAADHPPTRKVLQAVADLQIPAEAFIRDAPAELKAALRAKGIEVHDTPPPLPERLPHARAILHHAGMGTLEAALGIGCPQILLPRHLEQSLNARNLAGAGIAALLTGDTVEAIRENLPSLLAKSDWRQKARGAASALNKKRPLSGFERVMNQIDRLAA